MAISDSDPWRLHGHKWAPAMREQHAKTAAAAEKFNESQRAADAAYAASDRGEEAGRVWTEAIRSAQAIVRAEREAAARLPASPRRTR